MLNVKYQIFCNSSNGHVQIFKANAIKILNWNISGNINPIFMV
jgi:hypothetical protein